jgi:hypothetical protein
MLIFFLCCYYTIVLVRSFSFLFATLIFLLPYRGYLNFLSTYGCGGGAGDGSQMVPDSLQTEYLKKNTKMFL